MQTGEKCANDATTVMDKTDTILLGSVMKYVLQMT